MQIILRKEVDRLGFPGDVVNVRNGYARNFLLPRGLAVEATRGALGAQQKMVAARERREENQREKLQALANTLQGKTVTIVKRAGSKGKLYGSVTAMDLHEAILAQFGVDVERRKLVFPEAVKLIGEHERTVAISRGIEATLTIRITREGEEIEEPAAEAAEAPVEATEPQAEQVTEEPVAEEA
jgi:large subunit ribosomal protein L9